MDKTTFSLIELIDISLGDPISAIAMNNHTIILGSMTGKASHYNYRSKLITTLINGCNDHISSISFEEDDVFTIAMGNEEVIRYTDINTSLRVKNFVTEKDLVAKWQNSYAMLHKSMLFIILLIPMIDTGRAIENKECDYIYKNLKTSEMKTGIIQMTNFSIPFDFTGDKFLWIEFLSKDRRNIKVADLSSNDPPQSWEYALPSDFGHISHARILPDQSLFIVRKMNICEIRLRNDDFTKIASLNYAGDEVIAISLYYNDESKFSTIINGNPVVVYGNKDDNYPKMILEDKKKDSEENIDEELHNKFKLNARSLGIILLDINGNVNGYENGMMKKIFNMNEVKNISKDHKAKGFFSLGYPYYIRTHNDVYAVTTDHGCYVISTRNDIKE